MGPAEKVVYKGDQYAIDDDVHHSTSAAFRTEPLVASTFKARTQYDCVQRWAHHELTFNINGSEIWPGTMHGDPISPNEDDVDALETFLRGLDDNLTLQVDKVSFVGKVRFVSVHAEEKLRIYVLLKI